MRRAYLFILSIFLCVCLILADNNDYNDYDAGLLDEIRSEEKRNFKEQKDEDVEEPFKNLLSELEDDIGELSDLNKRNNGGSSGKPPPQQKPITSPNTTQTNITATVKPTTQSIVTTNTSVRTSKAPEKGKPKATEKKQHNDRRKSNPKIKKPQKGGAVHNNPKKLHPQGGSKKKDSKQKGQKTYNKKNIRGRKKMKNRYRTDKNKMLARATCGKTKRYPTCMQIYRKCMYEKKKLKIRCKQKNEKNNRAGLEKNSKKKSNIKGKTPLPTENGLKTIHGHVEPHSSKSNNKKDKKHWKNKEVNNILQNSQRKQKGPGNGKENYQGHKNQNGKGKPSGDTAKPLTKDRRGKIKEDNDGRKILKERKAVEDQKKLVTGEVRGLLKYLRRVKGHLYDIDKHGDKQRGREANGKSNSN
ncbi:uncharacterized protein LOC133206190 [Saccostrea echinata]|uniref:uncharacterized protein LOC133206190 n=1 Tax=Saccostrea echinata TaxID=191078 RepID=UPI002A80A5EC|nr:uncharacterized protein LOC133206190 [Saccostrea echinata]